MIELAIRRPTASRRASCAIINAAYDAGEAGIWQPGWTADRRVERCEELVAAGRDRRSRGDGRGGRSAACASSGSRTTTADVRDALGRARGARHRPRQGA